MAKPLEDQWVKRFFSGRKRCPGKPALWFPGVFYCVDFMEKRVSIYLVRHGNTEANRRGLYCGRSDLSLDETGILQARALSSRLDLAGIDICFSSPLARCRQTAEIIFDCKGIVFDADLAEIDFGAWELKNWDEISALFPLESMKWLKQENDFMFPSGESVEDFFKRIERSAFRIKSRSFSGNYERVAVVAHSGVIRALICFLTGTGLERFMDIEIGNASVSCLEIEGGKAEIKFMNDRSHLAGKLCANS